MTPNEMQKKRRQAERYFKQRWDRQPGEAADDFGSYCVEQWLEGRDVRTHFEYLGLDFLRKFNFANAGRGSADLLCRGSRVALDSKRVSSHMNAESPDIARFIRGEAIRTQKLDAIQRATLILYSQWGLSLREIGECFGFTESWASIVRSDAIEIVRAQNESMDRVREAGKNPLS